MQFLRCPYLWLTVAVAALALDLNIDDPYSIKYVASQIASDLAHYYEHNMPDRVPGNLPPPYYWWECGAMFGSLVDYWFLTNDASHNQLITDGLVFQTGPRRDFMPNNQSFSEGNDDQGFWGMTVMSAAERRFPDPPWNTGVQWLAMAQAVFNTQAHRWDTSSCNGGIRWQIFEMNRGYDYKNTISNGAFFNLAARLALYTGNSTYADWAEKTWDWCARIGLISAKYELFDGSNSKINCTRINHELWSYNAGIFLHGAANMYSFSDGTSDVWRQRTQGILNNIQSTFFVPSTNIMKEIRCEDSNRCQTDQRSFKAYLARWMAATTQIAPWTTGQVMSLLRPSAKGAAAACSGGSSGRECGMRWTTNGYDGNTGVGESMSALEVIQGLLMPAAAAPLKEDAGGSSIGNPDAGVIGSSHSKLRKIDGRDKAGAAALSLIVIIGFITGTVWVAEPEGASWRKE